MNDQKINIGGWTVIPGQNLVELAGRSQRLEPRAIDVLLYLARRPGQVVSSDELMANVWRGRVVEDSAVYKRVNELRKAFGDDPHKSLFIETIPKRGYRLVAKVAWMDGATEQPAERGNSTPRAQELKSARHEPESRRLHEPATVRGVQLSRQLAYTRAIVTVVLFVALFIVGLTFVGNRSDPNLRPTVWSGERGGHTGPVWSPDGRSTVYGALGDRGEPFLLHIRDIGSPSPRPIARLVDFAVPLQWTTAGKILFADRSGLWAVSPTGTPPERLRAFDWSAPPLFGLARSADVSRPGSLLAYTGATADGRVGVFTFTLTNGEPEWYSPDPFVTRDVRGDAPFLRFSPDGKSWLLWWNAGRGAQEAWLLPIPADADNPPRRVLEEIPVIFGTPEFSWLPDNRHVVISGGPERRQAGPRELLLADTQSGRFKLLVSGTTAKRAPVISPSGDAFVYTDLQANFDVVTLDVTNGRITPVIDSLRFEHQPAWAAAAPTQMLAYITAPNNAPEVWLHEEGQPERSLATARDFPTSETTFFETPALSPDGAHVVYRRVEGPNAKASHLWIADVRGGAAERLTNETAWETGGSWSPDGQWFTYFVEDDGVHVLKKVRTTGQAVPQTLHVGPRDEPALLWLPAWSPDGQWILVPDRGALLAADGSGRALDLGTDFPCAFAETQSAFYCFQPPGSDGRFPVVVRDLDGNVARTVGYLTDEWLPRTALMPPGLRLSPTPDGSGLTYSVARSTTTSLWLIEGLADISLP